MANEDVKRALMEALGGSTRPRSRPQGMGESGKTISDADRAMMRQRMGETISDDDRARLERMMGRIPPVGKGIGEADTKISPEQMKMLEQLMRQQQGVRDKAERKAFPPPSMMENGGEVNGGKVKRKKKPKMGAVMKGRGGSYKGMK